MKKSFFKKKTTENTIQNKKIRPNYEYLSTIIGKRILQSRGKTAHVTDGAYTSVYKGQSMQMDDLRPYNAGDNIRDIDWKTSSRMGDLVVKNYVSERRKKALVIADASCYMSGMMSVKYSKKHAAIITCATAAFSYEKAGADFQIITGDEHTIINVSTGYKNGPAFLEESLCNYEKCFSKNLDNKNEYDVSKLVESCFSNGLSKTDIVIISDIYGCRNITDKHLKQLCEAGKYTFFCIDDIELGQSLIYDVKKGSKIEDFFCFDNKLRKKLNAKKQEFLNDIESRVKHFGGDFVLIKDIQNISERIVENLWKYQ